MPRQPERRWRAAGGAPQVRPLTMPSTRVGGDLGGTFRQAGSSVRPAGATVAARARHAKISEAAHNIINSTTRCVCASLMVLWPTVLPSSRRIGTSQQPPIEHVEHETQRRCTCGGLACFPRSCIGSMQQEAGHISCDSRALWIQTHLRNVAFLFWAVGCWQLTACGMRPVALSIPTSSPAKVFRS